MKASRTVSPQAEIETSVFGDTLPTMDELKMEYLEYLLEAGVRNAPGTLGIEEVSTAALAMRMALFNLGSPPAPIVLNKKIRISH